MSEISYGQKIKLQSHEFWEIELPSSHLNIRNMRYCKLVIYHYQINRYVAGNLDRSDQKQNNEFYA